jgi:hypothetical protein
MALYSTRVRDICDIGASRWPAPAKTSEFLASVAHPTRRKRRIRPPSPFDTCDIILVLPFSS